MPRPPRLALTLSLLGLTALGCSTVTGGRTGFANRWRTMASSGGTSLPTESGPPGATVAAELGTPEPATRATGRISGRVIDPKGRPVPNAEVRLADGSARVGRDLRATTDDAGGFTLSGLRAGGSYTLIAEGEVGRDALVGRASARAPAGGLRIRIRPENDLATMEEDAADSEPDRRVGRVSTRSPIDDQAESDKPADDTPSPAPPQRRRVNEADLPPAEAAETVDPFTTSARTSDGKSSVQKASRTGWRRGKTDSADVASEADPLERTKSSGKDVIPTSDPGDDESNPLPPAKERPESPLSSPSSEPASSVSTPASSPSTPEPVDPTDRQAPETNSATVEPPSRAAVASVAIPAEAAPGRRATWADVSESSATVAVARSTPLPISTRRLPTGGTDAQQSGTSPAAPAGRFSFLGLKGKKTDTPANTTLAAASCRFDAKSQRIIDFQLPGLDGKATRFQDLDADFVLIDFWGTWCKPCIGSIPHLVALQEQYGPKTLRVIGVATEQDGTPADQAQKVDQVARSLGVNYPLLLSGTDGRACPLQEALHIQAYPTMILVDRSGRILWRGTGAEEITMARLDRVIAARADTAVLRR